MLVRHIVGIDPAREAVAVAQPVEVAPDQVSARFENGILTLQLPKQAVTPAPHRVPIESRAVLKRPRFAGPSAWAVPDQRGVVRRAGARGAAGGAGGGRDGPAAAQIGRAHD